MNGDVFEEVVVGSYERVTEVGGRLLPTGEVGLVGTNDLSQRNLKWF